MLNIPLTFLNFTFKLGTLVLCCHLKNFQLEIWGRKAGCQTYCIRSSNTAELATVLRSYNMAVRPRAVLSAHQVAPLYTVHDQEKFPPQAQNEYKMAALSSIEKKLYRVQKKVKNLQLMLINMKRKCIRFHI